MNTYRPTWAEINLDSVKKNFENLKNLTSGSTKFCCIIKANGYGHGSVELAKHYEQWGADYFGVATAKEALELRNAGIEKNILCLGYTHESSHEKLIQSNVEIPVFSMEMATGINEIAKNLNKIANIHIKLDTGMSRLGFQCTDEAVDIIEQISKLDNINLRGLFTHFARADEFDKSCTKDQFIKYSYVYKELEKRNVMFEIRHVCNSAGTIMYPEYHLDMVRVGISLYGHYPSNEVDKTRVELTPAMEFKSTISHVKALEKGRGIGYGHRYISQVDGEYIATMPIGYADGFTRIVSKDADVSINGKIYPLAGNICMDQSMIKVDQNINVGDEVTIFGCGDNVRVERLSDKLGTINYELLCMVQRRVPRVYTLNGKVINVVDYLVD